MNLPNAFMKTTLIAISAAAVALWGGFVIGYHNGVRDNEAKWLSMLRRDPDGRFVLKEEPPQPRGTGHVNSPPDPAASK
jgi:hypothetical protein